MNSISISGFLSPCRRAAHPLAVLFTLLFAFGGWWSSAAADIVYLKNGSIVRGEVLEPEGDDKIYVVQPYGIVTLKRSKIDRIWHTPEPPPEPEQTEQAEQAEGEGAGQDQQERGTGGTPPTTDDLSGPNPAQGEEQQENGGSEPSEDEEDAGPLTEEAAPRPETSAQQQLWEALNGYSLELPQEEQARRLFQVAASVQEDRDYVMQVYPTQPLQKRRMMLAAFSKLPDEALVNPLLRLLPRETTAQRAVIVTLLSRFDHPGVVTTFRARLPEEEAAVQLSLIEILKQRRDLRSVGALVTCVELAEEEVAEAAARTLVLLKRSVLDPGDSYVIVRPVLRMFRRAPPERYPQVFSLMGALGDASAIDVLARSVFEHREPSVETREAAQRALAQLAPLEPEKVTRLLLDAYRYESDPKQRSLLLTLLGGISFAELVEGLIFELMPRERQTALRLQLAEVLADKTSQRYGDDVGSWQKWYRATQQ